MNQQKSQDRHSFSRHMLRVVESSTGWNRDFNAIKDYLSELVSKWHASIEHVGSTAIPGLASRPIIDIDIIISHDYVADGQITAIESLGYLHEGEKRMIGRHAFRQLNLLPRHHLYLCLSDSGALKNHLAFRDYLLRHPEKVAEYSSLKQRLAMLYPYDRQSYIKGKTGFIVACLREAGLSGQLIRQIEEVNYARESGIRSD